MTTSNLAVVRGDRCEALLAAGHALTDPDLIDAGRAAVDALAARPGTWDTEGPTLCHGSAGVLLFIGCPPRGPQRFC